MLPFPILIAASAPVVRPVADAGSNVSGVGAGFVECGNPGSTGTPNASVSGGTSPYTYLWEQTGTAMTKGPAICSNSTALNPTWSLSEKCSLDATSAETWRLTVTDDNGLTNADSITVTLSWANLN